MGLPLLLQEASRPKIVFIGRDPAKIRKKLAEGGIDVRMLPNTVEAGSSFPNHNSLSLRLK